MGNRKGLWFRKTAGADKEQAAGPLRMAAGPLVPWSGVYSEGDIVPMKVGSQETGHYCRGLSPCAGPAPVHACPRKSSRFQKECVVPGGRLRASSRSAGRPEAQRSQLTFQVHKMVTVTRRVAWWGPAGVGGLSTSLIHCINGGPPRSDIQDPLRAELEGPGG